MRPNLSPTSIKLHIACSYLSKSFLLDIFSLHSPAIRVRCFAFQILDSIRTYSFSNMRSNKCSLRQYYSGHPAFSIRIPRNNQQFNISFYKE